MSKLPKHTFKAKCPTCKAECTSYFLGLDMVAETGDETLAERVYHSIDYKRQRDELLEALKDVIDGAEQCGTYSDAFWTQRSSQDLLNSINAAEKLIARAEGSANGGGES